MWNKTINSEKNALLLLEKIKIVSERLEEEQKLKNDRFENFNNYETLGYIVLGLGLGIWLISELPEQKNDEIDHYSKKLEDRTYVHCQSCGKKFTSMRKYGLEQDQITKNYAFCGQCYTNGEFIDSGVTLEGLIEESRQKNKKLPKFLQNLMIKRLKSLERWDL